MKKSDDTSKLKNLAERLIAFGIEKGADDIEVSIINDHEIDVDVRLGNIENLIEANSRYLSLRIFKDKKTSHATSSDLSEETLKYLTKNAIQRATLTQSDECSGLPSVHPVEADISSLKLSDPEIPLLDINDIISLAVDTEKIALQNKKITNSHGANLEIHDMEKILANSKSFLNSYDATFCSLSLHLQAGETDNTVEGSWFSSKRFFNELEKPEQVAKKAVEKTLRQLNPRKIQTQTVPVVFEPFMTSWLLGFLFYCLSGTSIYQQSSFLTDKLNQRIGNNNISVYDDGLLPGQLGTRPFDSEGVPCQKTEVIKNGFLKNYLCNTYAARKLKLRSTGNAAGSGAYPTNFYLEPEKYSPNDIISSLDKGLILIRTIGHGLNPVTGDISRGAFGLWVENGDIQFPVSEITVSGNLGKILYDIEMIGNDLDFFSQVSGPTIKVAEMTVAGA